MILVNQKNLLRIDPTRTATIRRRFMAEMTRRFKSVSRAAWKLIVQEDVFGLNPRVLVMQEMQAWRFHTDSQKITAYHDWLQKQIDEKILTTDAVGKPWTATYVDSSYKKGIQRAYMDVNKMRPDFYEGTQSQFLQEAFNAPEMLSKLELLSTRTFEELRGVTASMSQQMSRALATGIAQGQGPVTIAREMTKTIQNITKRQALVIARTEVIHAHAEGQLDSFDRLGVEKVGVMAEWSTAGDDIVCERCSGMDGEVMTVAEARGLIPLHPNCRCAWIPSDKKKKVEEIEKFKLPENLPETSEVKALLKTEKELRAKTGNLRKAYKAGNRKLRPELMRLKRELQVIRDKLAKVTGAPVVPAAPLAPVKTVKFDMGDVGKLKELPPELAGGKTGFDAMEFSVNGKRYFAKRLRSGGTDTLYREVTSSQVMQDIGLGQYTPKFFTGTGTYQGKQIKIVASEFLENYKTISSLDMRNKYILLNKVDNVVKERLVLNDYLMSAWDRSASNLMVNKVGRLKMLDYELAFSKKAPDWTKHELMQFLGKQKQTVGVGKNKWTMRLHKGKVSDYKFNQEVLKEAIDSGDDMLKSIAKMDIPESVKKEYADIVQLRLKELHSFKVTVSTPAAPVAPAAPTPALIVPKIDKHLLKLTNSLKTGVSQDYSSDIANELAILSKKFPKVSKKLNSINIIKRPRGTLADAGKTSDKIWKINLSNKYFAPNSKWDLARGMKISVKRKLSAGSGKVSEVFTHEFGHLVHRSLPASVKSQMKSIWWRAQIDDSGKVLMKTLGRYANTSSNEMFAEAFVQWRAGNTSALVKKIMKLARVKGKLGKIVGKAAVERLPVPPLSKIKVKPPISSTPVRLDKYPTMSQEKAMELSTELRATYADKLTSSNFAELESAIFTRSEGSRRVLAYTKGRISGAISYHIDDMTNMLTIDHIGTLLAPKGTGAELMRSAVEYAYKKGIGIRLESTPGAKGFYIRLGFRQSTKVSKMYEANISEVKEIRKILGSIGRVTK